MPNQFLTVVEIARQGLPMLQNNLVMPALINVNYSNEFAKKGDTIQVEKPAVYIADEFGGTINIQNINPSPVLVKLDRIADVSVEVTAKQLSLNVDDFNRLVLAPAVLAIAEKINNDGLDLYKAIPYFTGVAGTTPDGLDDFANTSKVLNDNKVPTMERRAVWNTTATAKFQILDALVGADKSGSTEALREGAIGKTFGLGNFMSQAVRTHTAGGFTSLADARVTVNITNNTTDATTGFPLSVVTINHVAATATTALKKGDLFTVLGKQYTVVEDTANGVAGSIANVKVYPQFTGNLTNQAIVFPDVTARAHVANLAFHRDAFTFVNRPLEPTVGAQSYTTNFGGIALRVTMDYDITTKKTIMSIDTIYGFATLYPELAARILG